MNISFVLGNGFDIRMGFKTSYNDFYQFLEHENALKINIKNIQDKNNTFHPKLIGLIRNHQNLYWSDLEMLFGNNLNKFDSIQEIKKEKTFLEHALSIYLMQEEGLFSINSSNSGNKIIETLNRTIEKVLSICEIESNNEIINVDFLTLNYTRFIDRIIEDVDTTINRMHIMYKMPHHMHGTVNNVLLGVDNEQQYILPDSITKSKEINRLMLKPVLNSEIRDNEKQTIENIIKNSDIIVIFGASIGATDISWWQQIAKSLLVNNSKKLIIAGYIHENSGSATSLLELEEYKNRFITLTSNVEPQNKIDKMILTTKMDGFFELGSSITIANRSSYNWMSTL